MSFIKRIKKGKHIYLAEVQSVREGKKVKHKFIRYVGKEVDGKTILTGKLEDAQISKVSIYGPLLVLYDIASRFNLFEIFEEQAPYILSLAFAHCVEPGSLATIQKWYERTDLQHLLGLKNVTYDKLLDSMDFLDGKQKIIQKRLFDSLRNVFDIQPDRMFYDVTNVYFYGSCCPLAKKGHNKEKRDKEQVQIGLAVTKDEKLPIFHKVFEGNIHDSRTIRHLFDDFEFNQRAWIVWDRGITSAQNIADAMKAKFHVLCGLSLNPKIKEIIDDKLNTSEISNFKNRVKLTKSVLYAKQIKYKFDDIDGYLTLCYNEKEKVAIKERRYENLNKALDLIHNEKKVPHGLKKYFRHNRINHSAVLKAERYDGISAVFSTKKLPPEELLKAYFEKDVVEKAFKSMKSTLEIRPIRHWLTERVRSHIFICYIAYYLMSILEFQLRALKMTAPQALEKLKTLYKVYIIDPKTKNTFTKVVTLNKEQKEILKTVNKQLLKCSQ